MSQDSPEFWKRARRAREKLVDQFIYHPDVNLIDIGYAPERTESTEEIVLRIHVRERWMKDIPEERVAFPEQVDGIPVVVMPGQFHLEKDSPAPSEESNHLGRELRSSAMGTKKNVAASAGGERADLETMSNEETRNRCKALAKSTGKRCKKAALPDAEYCPVHQRAAGRRAEQPNSERMPPEKETAKAPEQASPKKKEWEQHAGFSVFFDYRVDKHGQQATDKQGKRIWQTRVYDNKSGTEEPLPGIDTAPWVNWVLKLADLPVTAEPISTETTASLLPAQVAQSDVRIEILPVRIFQIGPSPVVSEKMLSVEVRFQVSGTEVEKIAAERVPFWIQVHTVALESGAVDLVASEQSQLQPEIFEYTSQQTFSIPDLGRYELHSLVLLLPPIGRMASYQGPTFKVVP